MSEAALEVITLGVGNYFATERYCTSLLLEGGQGPVLVDCPDPFFRMCADASRKSGRKIDPAVMDHVIITHMHGDHCNGLEGFGFYRRFVAGQERPVHLYTSHEAAEVLWQKLSVSMEWSVLKELGMDIQFRLEDFFQVHPFEIGDEIEVRGIRFQTRRTLHTLPCFGFRATRGGRIFSYSCDTAFDPRHIEFLEPGHLIFHECDKGIHTPLGDLEGLPEAIRSKMRLVHLGDEFPGSPLLEAAQEGRVYCI